MKLGGSEWGRHGGACWARLGQLWGGGVMADVREKRMW